MNSLVLMACSGSKRNTPSPAFDLYQGVMFETFRAHARAGFIPDVIILSALYGFIGPKKVLSPYDQKMTTERADEMIANLPHFMSGALWPNNIKEVFLAGGLQYRRVMRAAVACVAPMGSISECNGGIGLQRSQLGRYLDSLVPQSNKVIGRHPNGTRLFDSLGKFKVEDQIVTHYRCAPWAPARTAVIRELFEGPSGPTATIEMMDGKSGRKETRWISLNDIQKMAITAST